MVTLVIVALAIMWLCQRLPDDTFDRPVGALSLAILVRLFAIPLVIVALWWWV